MCYGKKRAYLWDGGLISRGLIGGSVRYPASSTGIRTELGAVIFNIYL